MFRDFICIIVLPTVIAITFLFTLIDWGSKIACEQQTESFEYSRYGFFSGCMVKHEGQWIPLANIRWEGKED